MSETNEKRGPGRPRKSGSAVRAAVWCIELYPDNADHDRAVAVLRDGSFDYAGILHDSDVWSADDESANPEHVAGVLKKAHYHIVLRYANAVRIGTVAADLGIEARFIQVCRNTKRALRYLIHLDDPDKFQYDRTCVIGTMNVDFIAAITREPSEGDRVAELIDFIASIDRPLSTSEFAGFCARSGYWDVFRRAGSIFCRILSEHNSLCERSDYVRKTPGKYADELEHARFEGFVEGHHSKVTSE